MTKPTNELAEMHLTPAEVSLCKMALQLYSAWVANGRRGVASGVDFDMETGAARLALMLTSEPEMLDQLTPMAIDAVKSGNPTVRTTKVDRV